MATLKVPFECKNTAAETKEFIGKQHDKKQNKQHQKTTKQATSQIFRTDSDPENQTCGWQETAEDFFEAYQKISLGVLERAEKRMYLNG